MDWLNLHVKVLDSPEVVGSDPVDRGTWLMLQRYSIGQENGGRISNCRGWKDRKWQQLARVTLAEVNRVTDLWTWEGNDLVVAHYPSEKEKIVQTKREIARENGTKGGRPTKPTPEPTTKPMLVFSGKAEVEVEGKGKGSGKEGEVGGGIDDQAVELAGMHPKRSMTMPVLRAAAAAIVRHGFETVAAGVRGYAAAVAEWTPAERSQFVKNPEVFFAEDLWNQPQANWPSRTAARTATNGNHRPIHVGGRKPSGIMTFDDEP